jgi:hypothetical protein
MSRIREMLEAELPLAEAFVAQGEELLIAQRARVAERERRGKRSAESERLLKIMEATQALHVQHLAMLQRDLERGDVKPPAPYQPPATEPPPKRQPY